MRFAEVMGLMGATVQWEPHAITITGAPLQRAGLKPGTADIVH